MIATVFLSLLPYQMPTEHGQVSTQINTLSYAENNSVYDLLQGNASYFSESENAFTFNEVALTTQYRGFSFSLFQRYEWFLNYSRDTLPFYGTTENGTFIEQNRTYNLQLNAVKLDAQGLRFAYLYPISQFRFYAAASYYQANSFLDGTIKGNVSKNDTCINERDCYFGKLDLSYFYTEDVLLGRNTSKPNSLYGFGVDAGADWSINERLSISLLIQDAYSKIVWENAPYTKATATTATSIVTDGYVKLNPAISGVEKNKTYTQHLPTKTTLQASYIYNLSHQLSATTFYAYGASITHLSYQYHQENSLYGFKLYPLESAIGINYSNQYIDFGVSSNPFELNKSELYAFHFGLRIPF